MKPTQDRIEPVILLLTVLVVFFALVLVFVAKWMSSDGQTFQVMSGLVTGFSGALLMRVKPRGTPGDDPLPEGTTRKTASVQEVHTETVVPPKPTGAPES